MAAQSARRDTRRHLAQAVGLPRVISVLHLQTPCRMPEQGRYGGGPRYRSSRWRPVLAGASLPRYVAAGSAERLGAFALAGEH
jgi:hypothetical protein